MTKFWMISNRNVTGDSFGDDYATTTTYWVAASGPLSDFKNWMRVDGDEFRKQLLAVVNGFPALPDPEDHEDQKHVTLFVHGYNNSWGDAAGRYESICKNLFSGDAGLGVCILFAWPSKGSPAAYLPDRFEARKAAPALADVLSEFYDLLLKMEQVAVDDLSQACRAKTSVIAHSMGNYVLQNAMHAVWTRKNRPLLVSLINQLLMVAADVDNDLFGNGELVANTDGDAIANLTYRVTALYTGRDPVLGLSAGLKHFGKRRLGRSGLDRSLPVPDNVWQVDCSTLISDDAPNIHSSYFYEPLTLALIRELLRGIDRTVLVAANVAPPPVV